MLETLLIDNLVEFRQLAPAWDDLWLRSDITRPSARAELIAQCVEAYAPKSDFRVLIVQRNGKMLAGLILVAKCLYGLISAGTLPRTKWATYGTLLLDSDCDPTEVLVALSLGIRRLPWRIIVLDQVNIDRPCWSELRQVAAGALRLFVDIVPCAEIGWIDIPRDWQAFEQTWSKNHRRNQQRTLRRLRERGEVQFRFEVNLDPAEVAAQLDCAFAIEDLGWKGAEGTSVLRTTGMRNFYVRQAEQLARWGQLLVAFLEIDGRPIAFDFGWLSKGVFHSRKIGYDPDYSACSPGHLLLQYQLQWCCERGDVRAIDCMGPLTDAIRLWRSSSYRLGRVVIVRNGLLWPMAYNGYSYLWQSSRRRKEIARHPS